MQKSLFRVAVDIKVGAEWVAKGKPFAARHILAVDALEAGNKIVKYEKTITYGTAKVTAVRVLSVELVVNDVLVL